MCFEYKVLPTPCTTVDTLLTWALRLLGCVHIEVWSILCPDASAMTRTQSAAQLQTALSFFLPDHAASAHRPPGVVMPKSPRSPGMPSSPECRASRVETLVHGDGASRTPRLGVEGIQGPSSPSLSRGSSYSGVQVAGELDIADVYAAVRPTGKEPQLDGDLPQLIPKLRPYQRRAAAWMVGRELAACGGAQVRNCPAIHMMIAP